MMIVMKLNTTTTTFSFKFLVNKIETRNPSSTVVFSRLSQSKLLRIPLLPSNNTGSTLFTTFDYDINARLLSCLSSSTTTNPPPPPTTDELLAEMELQLSEYVRRKTA
jgi:hypothetical protein